MANYVKFYRGSYKKYETAIKQGQVNDDTLYFITDAGLNKGALYLGDTLISKDISNLSEIANINISETLKNKDLLVYDAFEEAWVNKSILDAIGVFVGAQDGRQGTNGLVPAPIENGENLFLRGDGTWAMPEGTATISIDVDKKSVSFVDEKGATIGLNNFGKKYYKYVAATETEAAHYIEQIVDDSNPWLAGLEARTVEENGEIVLGWFEPNLTTLEGLQDSIVEISDKVDGVKEKVEGLESTVGILQSAVASKADASSVYTKTETNNLIASEIAKVDRLTRKVFASKEEAETFIAEESHPENYIYMILNTASQSESDKYDEYMYLEGKLEIIGSSQVDLTDYVKKSVFDELDGQVNNLASLLNEKVDKTEIIEINSSITNLSSLLNNKADKSEITEINSSIETLSSTLGGIDSRVSDISDFLNSDYFVKREDYDVDMALLKDAITWKDL